jgi:hypothetical protein
VFIASVILHPLCGKTAMLTFLTLFQSSGVKQLHVRESLYKVLRSHDSEDSCYGRVLFNTLLTVSSPEYGDDMYLDKR